MWRVDQARTVDMQQESYATHPTWLVQGLPLPVVKTSNNNGIPEWIHLGSPAVHGSGQPGMNGLWTVTVTISQQLLINSSLMKSCKHLRQTNHLTLFRFNHSPHLPARLATGQHALCTKSSQAVKARHLLCIRTAHQPKISSKLRVTGGTW